MNGIALQTLESINQLFEAGIAITALSLFIRALSFNLQDRVARGFAVILAAMTFIYGGEALSGAMERSLSLETWIKFQWVGIILLPSAYLHFSDALLETTGRPSRGRRRTVVRMAYLLSIVLLVLLPGDWLTGPLIVDDTPIPHLERTLLTAGFSIYYVLAIFTSATILVRSYHRTRQSLTRRRMGYLMGSSIFAAFGSYPFLLVGSDFAANVPIVFLSLAALGNLLVFIALVMMAYAVAFFGLPWPDRIVKKRLLKWFLRGPVTIFVVLAIATLMQRLGEFFSLPLTLAITIVTVIGVLIMEHGITLGSSIWEPYLFNDGDYENTRLLDNIQERLVTTKDLRQFLESILAAVCDLFQVSTGFVIAKRETDWEYVLAVGEDDRLPADLNFTNALEKRNGNTDAQQVISWRDYWLIPLVSGESKELIGALGVLQNKESPLEDEQLAQLSLLGERTVLALEDLQLQRQLFQSLEALGPRVEMIQRLRAASQYNQKWVYSDIEAVPAPGDLSQAVKDALNHFWGGPKLTRNTLFNLKVVQTAVRENKGNLANGLRAILREAIENNRPEGERRTTSEWTLYNIIDLKFLQGLKVREVARRLSLSEADLYRKQRVAIDNVAESIRDMEEAAMEQEANGAEGENGG